MTERLVIFGATGDLTARYLLPGSRRCTTRACCPTGSR
jgi:glucose-6-phosphate 1-dehydrogenase